MSKKELANLYKISRGTLSFLLNVTYFKELQKVGYTKEHKLLTPLIVEKFIELYGRPITLQAKSI